MRSLRAASAGVSRPSGGGEASLLHGLRAGILLPTTHQRSSLQNDWGGNGLAILPCSSMRSTALSTATLGARPSPRWFRGLKISRTKWPFAWSRAISASRAGPYSSRAMRLAISPASVVSENSVMPRPAVTFVTSSGAR